MLRNYLKMALKVLLRKKLYTFISIFGISLTLAILMIVSAFWEHLVGQQAPEINLDRSLFVQKLHLIKGEYNYGYHGSHSIYFMETYVSKLMTPELSSFYTYNQSINTYANGQELNVERKYTDASFWQVMQHQFLEGRPYTAEEILQRQAVGVIARSLKEDLFGLEPAIGKEVEVDQQRFRVVGVIENSPITRIHSYGTLFVPYTFSRSYGESGELEGEFVATLLAKDKESLKAMRQEYMDMIGKIPNPDPANVKEIISSADPYLESWSRQLFIVSLDPEDSKLFRLYFALSVLTILFLLLPTVNLININMSRITERSAEIGARKAFGASSVVLTGQFIIENLILSVLSGLIAFGVAWSSLLAINKLGIIPYMVLTLNMEVFWMGIFFTIFIGFLSGVYPAWRMSRLQAAEALKVA